MKKLIPILVLALAVFSLQSCGTTYGMYYWGGNESGVTKYEDLAYKYYKAQTPQSLCNLLCAYEDMVNNPKGTRQVPPPGLCAEYGYLLLQEATAENFMKYATTAQKKIFGVEDVTSSFNEKGRQMLEKEMQLYPESVLFIQPLVKKFVK